MMNEAQCNFSIEKFKESVKRIPEHKILNINTDASKRDENFCVFIVSFGRANNNRTWETLIEYEGASLNQDLYFICSDDDDHLDEYIEKFGEKVLVFNKQSMTPYLDKGDNFDRLNVVVYARNICFTFAKMLGYQYFLVLDDDYDIFGQRIFYDFEKLMQKKILDYDNLFRIHLDFLKTTPCTTISISQNGDYMGGAGNGNAIRGWQRKVMNSFFCDIERPYFFDGTINEDVNYYVQAGRQGLLNFNLFGFTLNQETTQVSAGGLTTIYKSEGTYFKSFYSVMYAPSCVKIGKISHGLNARLHHKVNSNATYPKILDEKYSKNTYEELHGDIW